MSHRQGSAAAIHRTRRRARRLGREALLETVLAGRRAADRGSLPDFVIVGAQRCGTTSLFRALAGHPHVLDNVLGAKGAHYFDTGYHHEPGWYQAHFPSAAARRRAAERSQAKVVAGEASPYYLFHPLVASRMAADIPDARVIVLLRDPVSRAYSHYQHMVWEGHEPLGSFEQALDAEEDRLSGVEEAMAGSPNQRFASHQHFSYVRRGMYGEQVERLLSAYSRDQVLVMATDDLVHTSGRGVRLVQDFLGLRVSDEMRLERRNAGAYDRMKPETRSRLAARFADSNDLLVRVTGQEFAWH